MTVNDPVWSDVWNPEINEWNPSGSDYPAAGEEGVTAYAPPHTDQPDADPVSEQYGHPDDTYAGSTEDARANLLTEVRAKRGPVPGPPVIVRHEVSTTERGAEYILTRTIRLSAQNPGPVELVADNPNRKRALFRVTSATTLLIRPARSGGIPAPGTGTVAGTNCYPIDSTIQFEYKGQAALEGLLNNGGDTTDVAILEELVGPAPQDPAAIGAL